MIACRFANSPTITSPVFVKPTTDGVLRLPSALGMTVGTPDSRMLTTDFVVPRSIPMALGMSLPPRSSWYRAYELSAEHYAALTRPIGRSHSVATAGHEVVFTQGSDLPGHRPFLLAVTG